MKRPRFFIKASVVITDEDHKPIFSIISDSVPFECVLEDFTDTDLVRMVQQDLEELRDKALMVLQG